MTAQARAGVRPPVPELERWLARYQVTPLEAYKLGAGEPCPHYGTTRRSGGDRETETGRLAVEVSAAPVIYR